MLYQYNEHVDLRGKNLYKKHPHDAGWDIRTPVDLDLMPGSTIVVETGLHIRVPKGLKGVIQSRSGGAINHCIEASNAGVIDYGFTGECKVRLYNNNYNQDWHEVCWADHVVHYKAGDRIAQIVFDFSHTAKGLDMLALYWKLLWQGLPQVVPEIPLGMWPRTGRGAGGFGSTGVM